MCGRFALGIPKVRLEEAFSVSLPDGNAPRYNVAPGDEVVTIGAPDGVTSPVMLRWGLVPSWAKDATVGFSMINARSETVFEKPAFRESIRTARCLVPVQAFYEWQRSGSTRQPHAIGLRDIDVFAMAGIAAHFEDHSTCEVIDSFSILTCQPNELMASIHVPGCTMINCESFMSQCLPGGDSVCVYKISDAEILLFWEGRATSFSSSLSLTISLIWLNKPPLCPRWTGFLRLRSE